MLDIARFEGRRRFRGTLYVSAFLVAYSALIVWLFPSISEAAVNLEAYVESLPPEIQRAFGGDASTYTSLEGFLVAELYTFGILLVLGVYFAYACASSIAGEIDRGSVDFLLANPVSRSRIVVGKYLALLPGMVVVNVVLFGATVSGVAAIGESIDAIDLLILHVAALPYLLACAGVGMIASIHFDSPRRAQGFAGGAIFGMFLLDTVTFDTDYEWMGDLAFSRYYNPADILIESEVALDEVALLVIASIVLVIVSAELFERKDIP